MSLSIYCEECGNEITAKNIVCRGCLYEALDKIEGLEDTIKSLEDELGGLDL